MSLLAKAQSVELKRRGGKSVSDDEMALAIAWVHGQVSITQVAGALEVKTGGVYPFLANCLKEYIRDKQ